MDVERWRQIEELYHAARARGAAALANADPELRRQVESLLAQDFARGILDLPAAEVLAEMDEESLAKSSADLAPGTQLGPYRITGSLGAGGMGQVFEARDTRLGRSVAIKVCAARFSSRFAREARAISALNHPHVCTLYDIGPNYLVMELVQGPTLAERLKRGALPLEEALAIARQIAAALEDAHDHGIVHRDLKPANIKIKPDGTVKVLDFGLARVSGAAGDAASTVTEGGTILGTPHYMAPEQAEGKPVDKRADIWSFGVVLYEMVTGQQLFPGDSVSDVLAAVLTKEPDWDRTPPKVQRLLRRCLERDPRRRLRDIGDVTDLLDGPPQSARSRVALIPWVVAAVLALAWIASGLWPNGALPALSRGRFRPLTATDTVVLADFFNSTSDAAFDDTLKEALSEELIQSPFLSILPRERVSAMLRLMGKPPDAPLSRDTAREVCLRAGGRAYILGSISTFGSRYVITLQAVECQSTDVMAREQDTANDKEQVLRALGHAGQKLRETLGESLASVRKFGTPLDEVTTPSLEALKSYSLGRRMLNTPGAIPLFEWAIRLDPNFAMAHLSLGLTLLYLNETARAVLSFQTAYGLRERVSEWERFAIESRYYYSVVGDLLKARDTYATWWKNYPRALPAIGNVGHIDAGLGYLDEALEAFREQVRLEPDSELPYANLGFTQLELNRLDEAAAAAEEAVKRKIDAVPAHHTLYLVAFLRGDRAGMAEQVAWAAGKTAVEDQFAQEEARTAAYAGRLVAARKFSGRATMLAEQVGEMEAAANYEDQSAVREALFGNWAEARERAAAALQRSAARDVEYGAGLALAIAGDNRGAERLAQDLEKRYPSDTAVKFMILPVIHGWLAVEHKDYAKAIELLQPAMTYELGFTTLTPHLYGAYLRAEAYLGAKRGAEAAGELQKVLSHRGVITNEPIGALARIGLARAYALQGDRAAARKSYEDFFTLWKEADSRIPVFTEAVREYRRLEP